MTVSLIFSVFSEYIDYNENVRLLFGLEIDIIDMSNILKKQLFLQFNKFSIDNPVFMNGTRTKENFSSGKKTLKFSIWLDSIRNLKMGTVALF